MAAPQGVRDIVSGLILLAVVSWGDPRMVGIVLMVEAMISAGDMSLVLDAKSSTNNALGIHGLTAALMILAATPMIIGPA